MEPFYLSVVVCVIGLVVYFASDKPKVELVGRWAYGIGLAAVLLEFGPTVIAALRR